MFFKKKAPSLSINENDKSLIDNSFESIKDLLGDNIFARKDVVLPTNQYFPIVFQDTKEYAHKIFDIVASIMEINNGRIDLVIYSERKDLEYTSGIIPIMDENEPLTTGKYVEYDNGDIEIYIEEQELKNPQSLVATLSHELAHYKLRHELEFIYDDEILTDLVTIAFGLGIFTANTSVIKMSTWSEGNYSGWRVKGGSGYLGYKGCGYALALYSFYKGEESSSAWTKYLEKDVLREYERSFKYLSKLSEKR